MSTNAAAEYPAGSADGLGTTNEATALAKNWWLIALRGALAILFGVIALVVPGATILALVLLFSAYMLVDAGFSFYAAYRAGRSGGRWGLMTLHGLAGLAAAGIALVWPGITVAAFVLLIGAWAIVVGSLLIAAAFRNDDSKGRVWFGLGGAVSMLYGFIMVVAPLLGAIVLTWWLGAFALVFGGLLLVLAFRLRTRRQDHVRTAQPAT
jgi:uncharacterized membrane protein HdeD (DUF308 family)